MLRFMRRDLRAVVLLAWCVTAVAVDAQPKVPTPPQDWRVDLVLQVPEIRYPTVVCVSPDGRVYVAVGDKGLFNCVGRDGKRIDMHGGGILRLRPDGTGLEIYCTGTRNILDVALDIEDDIFTYDNTDEHDWMGRLTHMVNGGFYGY